MASIQLSLYILYHPIQRRSTLKHSASNPPSYSGNRTMEVVSRAILVARDDKSFWEKYKWLVIGGAIAIPIQLVAGFFYLRYRKKKKAAKMMLGEEEGGSRNSDR